MIDPLRHLSVFSPDAFGARRVDIVGCGATGSRVALALAKLGVANLHVWDFDTIESHNIANQLFELGDVGAKKVVALARLIKAQTGAAVTAHDARVTGAEELGEVVFLLTDTMSSRKTIWDAGLKYKVRTRLLVETRMGIDEGRVYALDPNKPKHIRAWEGAWYPDQNAEVSACGASVTVGPTADVLTGLAAWQFVRWFAVERGKEEELDNEILFTLRPPAFACRRF